MPVLQAVHDPESVYVADVVNGSAADAEALPDAALEVAADALAVADVEALFHALVMCAVVGGCA
ncbi:MAG: hypothetical protein EOO65_00230 [Methanosarcinales archaeon]|nr:MAG: hypothetical protein EOO65_00230 [Methanosarcinales archaeon]